ncbi:MAG: RNA polymerase factor sigma-54 [Bacteroidota bacterium]|nr:RNA polymerase factor sigma-54 [Bacteroidota bacterium]
MLKQTYSQKLTQKHLPKIILTQNILSIPTLALDNIIKRELEMNPMLEEESEIEEEENDLQQINEETITESLTDQTEPDLQKTEESSIEAEEVNPKEEFDWDEYFENESDEYKSYDGEPGSNFDKNSLIQESSNLFDTLRLQLQLSDLSKKLIFIGEEILWSLNDDGYFTDNPEDILSDLDAKKDQTEFEDESFTIDELNEALQFIQKHLDPAGIAARNLNECLLIQIDRSGKNSEFKKHSETVLKNHFEDLRLKRYERISKEMNIDLEKVKEIFDFIHKLNPKPGLKNESPVENYIVPDLIVKKIDDKYEIFLNDKFVPSLRINRTYKNLYVDEKKTLDKSTKEYITNNFNRARWFIDAINSRRETMLKIMEAIIERQNYFFENNGERLSPLYEKDVAENIKMDTSTVSRAVRGKFVQTDFGIYELRSFFTSPLATNDGEDVSNVEAKVRLKEFIDNENKMKPLTDEELTNEMNKKGFKIARRTIAKYREAINIPVAKLRREI